MKYKAAYENQKGMMVGTDVTPEMTLSKDLAPIRSKKIYQSEAKEALHHHNVDAGAQEIANAMNMQPLASKNFYKQEYREEVLGKGPQDQAIAYPEQERLKKVHDVNQEQNYQREAKKGMEKTNIPIDAPNFVLAKETARNASDVSFC